MLQISINQLSIGYKKSNQSVEVLTDLNHHFYAGELIGLVGLNGVGKSTLIKSIAGLIPILKGEIVLAGISVHYNQLDQLAKKVSVVLTEKFGGFNLKALDVVCSGLSPYTNAFHQLDHSQLQVVEEAIQQCGLQNHQDKLVEELSDGFFQRTLIAKALAQQTPVMLLDEPTAYLDFASKHELFLLLKNLAEEQNKCIIISSHDLELQLKYCHSLLLINENSSELVKVEEAKSNSHFMAITKGFL